MILGLLAYVGLATGFVLLVLAIAAGLLALSEQVEEHTATTKRALVRLICAIVATHVLLVVVDGLPFWRSLLAVLVNGLYLQTLRSFPLVSLTSPTFLLAVAGAAANHLAWFYYFSSDARPPHSLLRDVPDYRGETHPPFAQIASFLGLLVWLVPLLLFISLSAPDSVLPTAREVERPRRRRGLAKDAVERVWAFLANIARTLGLDVASPYDDLSRG